MWAELDEWADALNVDTDDDAARVLASVCADLSTAVDELTAMVRTLGDAPDTDLVGRLQHAKSVATGVQESLTDTEYAFRTHRR